MLVPLFLLTASSAAAQATVCPIPGMPPGQQQSPIDIVGAVAAPLDSLHTHYPLVPGRAFNTGHDIQVDVDRGNYLVMDGITFHLDEFHFHWPGEHRMNGDTFPVEIHMVHRSAAERPVVVSTWVRMVTADNPAWATLWANLPTGKAIFPFLVDVPALFSLRSLNTERVYRYCGSLTTGEFAEGVTFLVRSQPITMSRDQVVRLRGVMGRWSRDPQPLNGRPIRYRQP
jgi:carbonic anhydrase